MKKLILLFSFLSLFANAQEIRITSPDLSAVEGYNVKLYGLKGDGSTDDRAALNTLLNTTAPTGSTIYFPPGTYNISSVISVSNKYFHFIGNQATLAMTANSQILDMRSTVALTGAGSRWTFKGLKFDGTGTGGGQSGLYFAQYSGLFEINDCLFTDFGNAGIAVASTENASTTQAGSFGGIVSNCRFYNNVTGISLLDRGEYVQIVGCQMVANTKAINTLGGNAIIDGNTISYNGTAIEISSGTNSGKDIISDNHITHNTTNLNAHNLASTQGLYLDNNHIISGTFSVSACTSGVFISGGQVNCDAYYFTNNTLLVFNDILFTNSLANTINLTGTAPKYFNCYNINGDQATDADNFVATSAFKYSLVGSATLDFGSTAAQTSSELTITVTGAADGDDVIVSPLNAAYTTGSNYTARVSSANTVSVAFNNFSTGAIDPASAVFKVTVIKQ
jgi:hypothetical protein